MSVILLTECDEGLSKYFLPYGHSHKEDIAPPGNQRYFSHVPLTAYDVRNTDGWKVTVRKVKRC